MKRTTRACTTALVHQHLTTGCQLQWHIPSGEPGSVAPEGMSSSCRKELSRRLRNVKQCIHSSGKVTASTVTVV